MRKVRPEKLTATEFQPYGSFADMGNPSSEKIGETPVEFYRDMVQQDLGSSSRASYSVCTVTKREPVVDVSEYHSNTGEGILPLDEDILIHVGPATPKDSPFPSDKIRIFRVPKGTMVTLRPGVWHHAPFATNGKPANVLIVLPERTYANDCTVVNIPESQRITILE